jgi:hypothetical protein
LIAVNGKDHTGYYVIRNETAAEQFNGREGETATFF